MAPEHISSFDQGFGEFLRRAATPISRRSLLGRSIKVLLGIAGVGAVGAAASPLLADPPGWGRRPQQKGAATTSGRNSTTIPPGFDEHCSNLHGVLCAGNCSPSAPGATDCLQSDLSIKQAAWVGCCKRKDNNGYQCYTMSDVVCATRPTNWLVNCPGNTPAGRIWFGGKLGKRFYVCTIPGPVGPQFSTGADCALNCTPDIYPNTWAC
jgi:hypothetical protein